MSSSSSRQDKADPRGDFQDTPATNSQDCNKSEFIKWQVSTELGLNEVQLKLEASRTISAKHSETIQKKIAENGKLQLEIDDIDMDNELLIKRLDDVKAEMKLLSSNVEHIREGLANFEYVRECFQSLEGERLDIFKDLASEFDLLKIKAKNESDKADAQLQIKKLRVENELSSTDQRVNSEAQLLDELSNSLKQAEDNFKKLEGDLKVKKAKIETNKSSINELEDKIKVAEEELISLRKEDKDNDEKGLKELQSLEKQIEIVSANINENVVQYDEAKVKADLLKSKYENHQDEIADMDVLIANLENDLMGIDERKESCDKEHQQLLKTKEALTLKVKEVEALKVEYSDLQTLLLEEEKKANRLQSDVDSLLAIDLEKASLDENNLILCDEIHGLEMEIKEKSISLQEVRDAIEENESNVKDQEDKRANFLKVMAKLQEEIGELERSIEEEEKGLSNLDSESGLSDAVNILDTEILSIEENLLNLNSSVAASIEGNKNLEEEITKINENKEVLKSEFDGLKISYDSSVKQLEEVDKELATLEASTNDSSATIKESKKKLKSLDTKHSKLTKESIKLQKDLDKKSKIVADYNEELASLDSLLSESLDRAKSLEEEIKSTKSTLESTLMTEAAINSDKDLINSLNEKIAEEEKNLFTKERSLMSAKKNSVKFSKQLESSTSTLDGLKDQVSVLSKSLEERQKMKEILNDEIKELDAQLTPDLVSSQGIRDSDQKIVNQVIKEHEAVIARMVNEQNLMQREYEGLLFSKENDYKEALAKLKLKVDQSKQEFQTKSHLYDLKMKELKEAEERFGSPDQSSKIYAEVEDAKTAVSQLETSLQERIEEGSKLEKQLESLRKTYGPQSSNKFFKTPRGRGSFRGQITPSPRKKLAVGKSPLRSSLAPPRVSPRKLNRRNSRSPGKAAFDEIITMSDSSQ